jgi:salicylate hydroxylase
VFRALERVGLKAEMLEDAWMPPSLQMRDALTGDEITTVPLGEPFRKCFGQPYAVTHRADIHGVYLRACRARPLVTLENDCKVEDFTDHGDAVTVRLANGRKVRGRGLIGADGMWSKVRSKMIGDGAPLVSGHIAYRAVLKREDVPDDLWRPDMMLWAGPRTHFVHYPLRRGTLYNLVAVFHSDRYVEGWNAEGSTDELWKRFDGERPEVMRLLAKIETWRMWVLSTASRSRTGRRAASRSSATPPTRCCNTSPRAPAWRPRTRCASPGRWRRCRTTFRAHSRRTKKRATCAPGRCRSWRACTGSSTMRAA